MLLLKPDGIIDLGHRALFLQGTASQSVVLAAAYDGSFSVISSTLRDVRRHHHRTGIRATSLHPTRQQFALVDGQSGIALLQTLEGQRTGEIAAPGMRVGTPQWVRAGFQDCLFDSDGEYLWLTASLSQEECEIRLVDAITCSQVDRVVIPDPFGGSSCSLHATARPGLLSLWLGAGQDGQQIYWVQRTGARFSCILEPGLPNTTPPCFSPNGRSFLVVDEERAIHRFDFPTMAPVGEPVQTGDDDNVFTESVEFLSERQALASTTEGRIFVLDTGQMKIEEEVALDGHEPRPIGVYYPTLTHENGIGTDIRWFKRLRDIIFFVCRRDSSAGLHGWKDSLLWVRTN